MIVARTCAFTPVVVKGNVALVLPAGTVTEEGTVVEGSLLISETTSPPIGAGTLMLTVPVEPLPPKTVEGDRVKDVTMMLSKARTTPSSKSSYTVPSAPIVGQSEIATIPFPLTSVSNVHNKSPVNQFRAKKAPPTFSPCPSAMYTVPSAPTAGDVRNGPVPVKDHFSFPVAGSNA